MDKTININLGNILFQIDEEAYRVLRNYLQALDIKLRNVPGGSETLEDIESRIAEIFQSQKGMAGVISKENVESMISIIGEPADFDQFGAEGKDTEFSTRRKTLVRDPEEKIIGGVCGGLGYYLNTDPVWIRILFVIFSLFFGIGFLIYLALWIAIPAAKDDLKKSDLSGFWHQGQSARKQTPGKTSSELGNAINEIFRAVAKVLYVTARIFLIIIGILLVITGFLTILSLVMVLVFRYPGSFSTDFAEINLSYIPDFLNYIVSPSIVPFIKGLIMAVTSIPFLVLIYFGIKMIFWFRAKDGVFLLSGLVIWVMSAAMLSIILFREGISFAESAETSTRNYLMDVPDTLYLVCDKRIDDLVVEKEIHLGEEKYNIYISDVKNEIYFRTDLDAEPSGDEKIEMEIKKRSCGPSRRIASERSERLGYDYSVSGDTICLSEFYTIPANSRWSFDDLEANLFIPEGTFVIMDRAVERLLHLYDYPGGSQSSRGKIWIMGIDGLRLTENE